MITVTPTTEVTAGELARLLGISYRRVDHWCSKGWLHPTVGNPGSGNIREWTDAALRHAQITGDLVTYLAVDPHTAAMLADNRVTDDGLIYRIEVGPFSLTGRLDPPAPEVDDE